MCVLFSFLKAWPLGWADTRLPLTGLFMKVESEDRWPFHWIAFNENTFYPFTETPHDKRVHTKQTQCRKPPKQDTCFSWHHLTRLLIVAVFFHYLLFVSFILISLYAFIIPYPPPFLRQTSLVQGTLLERTAERAQHITHKPLVNDKLLIITYSWKYQKVLLGHWDTNSSLRSLCKNMGIIANESNGNILNVFISML